uniref:uncharacterized protein LOC118543368 isoform X2 n=1 Tax=Halichoerus grypus TaxID=9711 RepID=UPI0016594193|nr:uncharacterized protein LOC118543368 isoform X2 [Halichoerus grypus]
MNQTRVRHQSTWSSSSRGHLMKVPCSPHDPHVDRRYSSHSDRSQPAGAFDGQPSQPASCCGPRAGGRHTKHQVSSFPETPGPPCAPGNGHHERGPRDPADLATGQHHSQLHSGTAGSPWDPWEDAELPLCRLTDHHGFLQEKEMPGPNPHEAKVRACPGARAGRAGWAWSQQHRQETRRADKWVKMLQTWDHYRLSEKMHRRGYKVVPPQVRGQVWALVLDIEQVKSSHQGIYEKMKEQAQLFSKDVRQIDLDVTQTFSTTSCLGTAVGSEEGGPIS